jgi:hypothetical protein
VELPDGRVIGSGSTVIISSRDRQPPTRVPDAADRRSATTQAFGAQSVPELSQPRDDLRLISKLEATL